jgi:cobyrinic acid a,c-diamide synthase
MAQLFLSAAHKSSGKTTVSLGLCSAFRSRGHIVQPFKKGPDYIDPMWLGMASGRPCRNLDFYLETPQEIRQRQRQYGGDADLCLIEGNKGLYDGLDLDGSNSNAALAKLLRSPVILVIDTEGMTRGIAPLILGYQGFDPDIEIRGVILNQVRGARHEQKLRAVIEHYTDVPVLGAVSHDPRLQIVERHLGLMPSNENNEAADKIAYIGKRIGEQVDLDRLVQIADAYPIVHDSPVPKLPSHVVDVRIGIARDAAFGFYYPDDLDALQREGAQLVPIDTLQDPHLPEIDALFIGGGFPEVHMAALERNVNLRAEIRAAIDHGMPAYAECGGLMYLSRSLQWKGETREMVGVIPGDIVMQERPVGRGYTRLLEQDACLWPMGPSDRDGGEIPAHEFHYSDIQNLPTDTRFAYRITRGHGVDGIHDGIVYRNLMANYVHLRSVARNDWTSRFVEFVRRCKYGIVDHNQQGSLLHD